MTESTNNNASHQGRPRRRNRSGQGARSAAKGAPSKHSGTSRQQPQTQSASRGKRPFTRGGARPENRTGNRTGNRSGNRSNSRPGGRGGTQGGGRGGSFRGRDRGKRGAPVHLRETSAANAKRTEDVIPPLKEGDIRIVPLGGVEEIGRNMTAVEINNEIFVVDCGFQFKEVETPGIDYILPNTKYLEDNVDRVKAIFITHGHLDHIGGIPFIVDRIGMPPIYTRNLTAIMIKKRQLEFPHLPQLDIRVVEKNDKIKVGGTSMRFFGVTHTIPDSMGIIFDTPYGGIVAPGDFKLRHLDGVPLPEEEKEYEIFKDQKTLLMLLDSTNVDQPGFSTPESYVHESLDQYIRDIHGRLIIGTFASQLERLIKIIESAEKYKKKIVLEGRSMKTNLEIAKEAGILKVKPDTIIPSQELDNYPKNKIVILATGAQGEEFAAMMRMANKSHKFVRLQKGDTVLLSASIVPGNEKAVERLKDNIARADADIISYRTSETYIHSSGHGNQGELSWLHQKINPKFFIPVHGNHYRLRIHAKLAQKLGMAEDHTIVPENSSVIEIQNKGEKIVKLEQKAPSIIRMVDGLSIGDIQEVVMRDRQSLAQDGMFVVIAMLNVKTGKLKKSPDIISRGFVYLRESQDLLQQTRLLAKKTVEESAKGMNPVNFDVIKKELSDTMQGYLMQKTNKHPIVIPVILGI